MLCTKIITLFVESKIKDGKVCNPNSENNIKAIGRVNETLSLKVFYLNNICPIKSPAAIMPLKIKRIIGFIFHQNLYQLLPNSEASRTTANQKSPISKIVSMKFIR
jgi:hypothetical protein